jgi:hypothetical protein
MPRGARGGLAHLTLPQQLRQLGDVGGDAPRGPIIRGDGSSDN